MADLNIRCRTCGTYPEEWKDNHEAYHADPYRCEGCETVEAEQDAWARDEGSSFGVKFRLKKGD